MSEGRASSVDTLFESKPETRRACRERQCLKDVGIYFRSQSRIQRLGSIPNDRPSSLPCTRALMPGTITKWRLYIVHIRRSYASQEARATGKRMRYRPPRRRRNWRWMLSCQASAYDCDWSRPHARGRYVQCAPVVVDSWRSPSMNQFSLGDALEAL